MMKTRKYLQVTKKLLSMVLILLVAASAMTVAVHAASYYTTGINTMIASSTAYSKEDGVTKEIGSTIAGTQYVEVYTQYTGGNGYLGLGLYRKKLLGTTEFHSYAFYLTANTDSNYERSPWNCGSTKYSSGTWVCAFSVNKDDLEAIGCTGNPVVWTYIDYMRLTVTP